MALTCLAVMFILSVVDLDDQLISLSPYPS